MKERPILFSAPMVRALLDGSKTQTRRPYKIRMHPDFGCAMAASELCREEQHVVDRSCPYGQPGDGLWVRETWADLEQLSGGNFQRQAIYRADDIERYGNEDEYVDVTASDMRWRPSIHMPRWGSRILLEIVSVRVERLNAISEADCWAEGIEACDGLLDDMSIFNLAKRMGRSFEDAAPSYAALWEQINGAGSWEANPWVWVVEFKRVTP